MPNVGKALKTVARQQTYMKLAQVACALERFRLANGSYPPSLDDLSPRFMATIPHDLTNGQPLNYRRTDEGQYVLYSAGWNEVDDGGSWRVLEFGLEPKDWVWQVTAQETK